MSSSEPTREDKIAIVKQRLAMWRNTVYEAHLDSKVAKLTEDDNLRAVAQKRARQALQAVTLMEEVLRRLERGEEDTGTLDSNVREQQPGEGGTVEIEKD